MIPVRIQLSGFLCYREPREACFRGRALWMLTGPNGSGKSALFDAVTYALFGQHRGGKRNARGLIHHGCQHLAVEFDFKVDTELFRARRTLSRQGRATRQILSAHDDTLDSEWTPVPETDTERGFARWVNEHVALSYETFTSSVLLLQGRAESLLLATPLERRRLLCQIVGLDRIEELAKQARNHLAETEGAAKACRHQMRQLAAVDTVQLDRLRQLIATARQQVTRHAARVERISATLAQAKRHHQLAGEIEQLQVEIDRIEEELEIQRREEADSLGRAELAAHRDALNRLLHGIRQVDQCRADIVRLEAEQHTARASFEKQESVARDAEQSIAAIREELAGLVDHERKLSEEYVEWRWNYATADRFAESRGNLQRNHSAREHLESRLQEARQQLAALADTGPEKQQVDAARNVQRKSAEEVTRRELLVNQMRQRLERFQSVSGERYCAYCLQPLHQSRCDHEHQRLAEEVQQNEMELQRARDRCVEAAERESALQEKSNRQQKESTDLKQRIQEMSAELHGLRLVQRELTEQCHRAWRELPRELRGNLNGNDPEAWTATTSPQPEELSRMQQQSGRTGRELKQLAEKRRNLKQSLDQQQEQQQQIATSREASARALDVCKEKLAREKAQLSGYVRLHASARSAVPLQWRELGSDELEEVLASMPDQSKLESRPSTSGACRGNIFQAVEFVRIESCPAQTVLPVVGLAADKTIRDWYNTGDAEQVARRHRSLQARRDVLIEQRGRLPVAAASDPEAVGDELRVARQTLQEAEGQLAARQAELLAAEQRNETHRGTKERWHATQRDCRLWKRLVKLLGADGLQQALLEKAQQAIVQYANTVLDRIAGGQLYVELSRSDSGRSRPGNVLDLVARIPAASAQKQDVAFLSGSQKFRVAVAISLAIGQFASNTRRPVQAVIIDEGFGCLDSMNRHVMIQELQNLRDHLQRILLVSHQDEFANAFPDGYRCELVDGATRLIPLRS